jgi:hypothetical protein
MLHPFLACNALIDLPAGHSPLAPGSRVAIIPFNNGWKA